MSTDFEVGKDVCHVPADIRGRFEGEGESDSALSGASTEVKDLPRTRMEGASSRESDVQLREAVASRVMRGTGWRTDRVVRSGRGLR